MKLNQIFFWEQYSMFKCDLNRQDRTSGWDLIHTEILALICTKVVLFKLWQTMGNINFLGKTLESKVRLWDVLKWNKFLLINYFGSKIKRWEFLRKIQFFLKKYFELKDQALDQPFFKNNQRQKFVLNS